MNRDGGMADTPWIVANWNSRLGGGNTPGITPMQVRILLPITTYYNSVGKKDRAKE